GRALSRHRLYPSYFQLRKCALLARAGTGKNGFLDFRGTPPRRSATYPAQKLLGFWYNLGWAKNPIDLLDYICIHKPDESCSWCVASIWCGFVLDSIPGLHRLTFDSRTMEKNIAGCGTYKTVALRVIVENNFINRHRQPLLT